MNGYLAGLLERATSAASAETALQQAATMLQQPAAAPVATVVASPAKPAVRKITLAYGTGSRQQQEAGR